MMQRPRKNDLVIGCPHLDFRMTIVPLGDVVLCCSRIGPSGEKVLGGPGWAICCGTCALNSADAPFGTAEVLGRMPCDLDVAVSTLERALRWRDRRPVRGEWDAPDVLGWAFRGTLREGGPETAIATSDRGIVVDLMVCGDDGLPLWAQYRAGDGARRIDPLFDFKGLKGQWCPIRVGAAL